jgi:hypothetical protein
LKGSFASDSEIEETQTVKIGEDDLPMEVYEKLGLT